MKGIYRVALAGNPNTGKSTLFNALTGLRQHTGNWAGKTVVKAEGEYEYLSSSYKIVDLPGTYSLFANSADEEVARDYIILEKPDVTVVVLDATSLERNLNLALQVLEMTRNVVICINLADEAKKLGISIDHKKLAQNLGVPVVMISARKKQGLAELMKTIHLVATGELIPNPITIKYSKKIEDKVSELLPQIEHHFNSEYPIRWIALRILDGENDIVDKIKHQQKAAFIRKEVATNAGTNCHA